MNLFDFHRKCLVMTIRTVSTFRLKLSSNFSGSITKSSDGKPLIRRHENKFPTSTVIFLLMCETLPTARLHLSEYISNLYFEPKAESVSPSRDTCLCSSVVIQLESYVRCSLAEQSLWQCQLRCCWSRYQLRCCWSSQWQSLLLKK